VPPPDDSTPLDVERVQELLWQLLQQPPDGQASWLAAQDISDAERDELRSLASHHTAAGTRFERPLVARPTESGQRLLAVAQGELPERIGGYRILRRLGSGGMGSVYEAEQEHPRRTVALKVMDRGLTSASARRRFAFESEALARLRHPGIAQVYEAVAPDEGGAGAPWFAMEFVPGARSLIDWAAAGERSLPERLCLFAEVCDAVHHGHQRGVIHRDLKPANILVTDEGRPKVIDFGVARMSEPGAGTGSETMAGQLMGTLGNMAPEQILGDPDEIDTRADVYALGTVLYELLTGRPAYALSGKSVPEATRIVTSEVPPRPSSLDARLAGDLDAIVLTAMERDRDRRYNSAAGLAADIRRHLSDEPILARRPTLGYQFQRFARRNKVVVTASAVVLLALIAASAVSLAFAWRAEEQARAAELARGHESLARTAAESALDAEADARFSAEAALAEARAARRDAEAAHTEALLARDDERVQREAAQTAQAQAEQFSTRLDATIQFLLEDVFSKPYEEFASLGRKVTIMDALDLAAADVGDIGDPWTEAEVRTFFGHAYIAVGRPLDAAQHLRRALALRAGLEGVPQPRPLQTLHDLAEAEQFAGNYETARELHDEILARVEGEGRAGSLDHAEALEACAILLRDLGQIEEALSRRQHAGEIFTRIYGPDHPKAVSNTIGRAVLQRLRGEPARTAELLPQTITAMLSWSPVPQEELAHAATELGSALIQLGRLDDAQPLLEEALAIRRRMLEPDHPSVAHGIVALGGLHHARGEFDRAAALYDEAIVIYRERFGAGHIFLAVVLSNRGKALLAGGRVEEAVTPLEQSLAGLREGGLLLQDQGREASDSLAQAYLQLDRRDDAARLLGELLAAIKAADQPQYNEWKASLERAIAGLRRESGEP